MPSIPSSSSSAYALYRQQNPRPTFGVEANAGSSKGAGSTSKQDAASMQAPAQNRQDKRKRTESDSGSPFSQASSSVDASTSATQPDTPSAPLRSTQSASSAAAKTPTAMIYKPTSRVSRACNACRKQKMRCEGVQPCNRCSKAKIPCVFEKPTRPTSSLHSARSDSLLPAASAMDAKQKGNREPVGDDSYREDGAAETDSMGLATEGLAEALTNAFTEVLRSQGRAAESTEPNGHDGGEQSAAVRATAIVSAHLVQALPGIFAAMLPQERNTAELARRLDRVDRSVRECESSVVECKGMLAQVLDGSRKVSLKAVAASSATNSAPPIIPKSMSRAPTMISTIESHPPTTAQEPFSIPSVPSQGGHLSDTSGVTAGADDIASEHLHAPIAALRGLADAAATAAAAVRMSPAQSPTNVVGRFVGERTHADGRDGVKAAGGQNKREADAEEHEDADEENVQHTAHPHKKTRFDILSPTEERDVVELGIIVEQKARQMFAVFTRVVPIFLSIFDFEFLDEGHASGKWFDDVRRRSILLFDTIVAIGCLIRSGVDSTSSALYSNCIAEAYRHAKQTLFVSTSSEETVQAIILLAAYSDNGWLMCGHATRMAQELGYDRAFARLLGKRDALFRQGQQGAIDDEQMALARQ